MKKMKKNRILALLLVCCMMITLMPEIALASVDQITVKPVGEVESVAELAADTSEDSEEEPVSGNAVLLSSSSAASSGTCGENLTWTFDEETGVLTISGTGDMDDYENNYAMPWNRYRTKIISIVIEEGVTSIGERTFRGKWGSLESISIASSVTSIGDYAFYSFESSSNLLLPRINLILPEGLTTIGEYAFAESDLCGVTIPSTVISIGYRAFYNSEITELIISDGVKEIGDYAFWATKITELSIPDSVVSIGAHAFQQCTSLTRVSIGAGVESIGDYAFHWCGNISDGITVSEDNSCYASLDGVLFNKSMTELILYAGETTENYTVPDGVEKIASYAFYCNDDFSSIEFPDSLLEIGEYAFYKCSSLTKIHFSEQLEIIGEDAFAYCDAITELVLPDSLVTIESLAFYKCEALETVSVGSGLAVIAGSNPFSGDSSLKEISVSEDNSWFYTEDGVLFDKNKTLICYPVAKSGTSYTVPDGTTAIGAWAFGSVVTSYSKLESVVIPDSVVNIGDAAFCSCINLTNVDFGEGVKYIDYWAFNGTSLASIDLPDSLTGIGERAFLGNDFSSVTIGLLFSTPC